MEYGKVKVKIRGMTPLLMNRLAPEALKKKGRSTAQTYDTKKEARASAYITEIDGEEQLYIPSYAVYSMTVKASGMYKVGKFYLSSLLAGSIRVEPEEILLGHCNYKVDERPVVIRGSRVLRARAKIPEWTVQFTIIYNKNLPEGTIELLKQILEDAGTRLGLLDYRPQHKGWFGTFTVENYEVAA